MTFRWFDARIASGFVFLVPTLAACADGGPLADGENDAFLIDGKADQLGIDPASPEACAVLKLASIAPKQTLDKEVRLDSRAAAQIHATRIGADGVLDTDDDLRFATLTQLDAVKWVGPQAFTRMLAFVRSSDDWSCTDVSVQLLALNDFHGAMQPPAGSGGEIVTDLGNATATPPVAPTKVLAGGAEYLATLVAERRATNPNTLVVAAGDNIGATPLLSAAFHDEPTIESLDAIGLDISSVGNHEFDEGIDELWRIQEGGVHPEADDQVGGYDGDGFSGARFRFLAANVIHDESGETVFPAFTVRRFGNARVAFIGMTLEDTPGVVTAQGVAGLSFKDEVETANALVPAIRAQGIETIVVLLHEGGRAGGLYNQCVGISGPLFDIAKALDPAIDVVVAGHTNAAHVCDIEGKLVTSAAHNGRLLTDIELVISEKTGDVVSKSAENLIARRTDTAGAPIAKDATQTAIIAKWENLIAPIANRVVATIGADLVRTANAAGESPLGDVIADAQLTAAAADGAIIAFMNPGGIRADLVATQISGGEAVGEVTYAELFSVQPFANNLVVFDLTGAQIHQALEQQWGEGSGNATLRAKPQVLQVSNGFTYTWSSTAPAGSRVDPASIRLDGVTIDPTATYRLVANVFLAGGGDGIGAFKSGTNRASGVFDLEALESWLAQQPGIQPPAGGRIVLR
jgi:5'-nucleotidase